MSAASGEFRKALSSVPNDVVTALEVEMAELESRFARGDLAPAELNGGRLAEALFRYLEWKQSGKYTPIGAQLNRTDITNAVKNDASMPEGIRFHVRRCADLLMDVRNKRDVAHLGTEVDVQEMDAQLVMRLASWSLSEIVRGEGQVTARAAQRLVDRFTATHIPLVEEIDGDLVVLATDLNAATRTLIALYHVYPEAFEAEDLRKAVVYKRKSRYRDSILGSHEADGLIYVRENRVFLTHKGIAWVEANVDFELRLP